jgi:hypothetical protein
MRMARRPGQPPGVRQCYFAEAILQGPLQDPEEHEPPGTDDPSRKRIHYPERSWMVFNAKSSRFRYVHP